MNLPDALDSHEPLRAAQTIEEILTKLRISADLLRETKNRSKELYTYSMSNTSGEMPIELINNYNACQTYMQNLVATFYRLHLSAAYRECLTNVKERKYAVLTKNQADLFRKMEHDSDHRPVFEPAKLTYVPINKS